MSYLLLIIICFFAPFVKTQEIEIIQRISKLQPILFIDADSKKVLRVKFPLGITLNNKANKVVSLISATYYGYGDYYNNSRKKWHRILGLYQCSSDTLCRSIEFADIKSNEIQDFMIYTEHILYNNPKYNNLFSDFIPPSIQEDTLLRINPMNLSVAEKECIRTMLEGDSLRIGLYSDKMRYFIHLPVDVNMILP